MIQTRTTDYVARLWVVALSAAVLLSSACGGPVQDAAARPEPTPAEVKPEEAIAPLLPNVPDESVRGDDALALEMARSACLEGDFRALFDVLVRSDAARRIYSADRIVVTRYGPDGRRIDRREIPAADYDEFPLRMEDVYRRPSAALQDVGDEEYIMLEFNQSQGEVVAVSWTRVRFDGQSEGGDDLGRPLTRDGRPLPAGYPADGTLVLTPTEDCWRFAADDRFARG